MTLGDRGPDVRAASDGTSGSFLDKPAKGMIAKATAQAAQASDRASIRSSGWSPAAPRQPMLHFAASLPEDLLDEIAQRSAALLVERELGPPPWIGVEEAAAHLACPKSRIYRLVSQRRIPHEKDGARLLFRRSDLDAWVESGGASR